MFSDESYLEVQNSSTPLMFQEVEMLVPEIAAMLSGRSYIFDDKKFDTKLRRRCMAKNKLFDFLSNEQKAYLLSQECLQLGDEFRNTMLESQIGNGRFQPWPEETREDQVTRCWREHYDQRIATPSAEGSIACTCTRCSRIIHKVLQGNNRELVLENGCQCEVGNPYPLKHLTAGWQFVVGEHPNYFPENNIFMLLAQSLPSERVLVVNGKQMQAMFVRTIRQFPAHPQSIQLTNDYGGCFNQLLVYGRQSSPAASRLQTSVTNALKTAFQGLVIDGRSVRVIYRDPKEFEKSAYTRGSVFSRLALYIFGDAGNMNNADIEKLENVDFLNYRSTLALMRGGPIRR
jgi:hypothetical protein